MRYTFESRKGKTGKILLALAMIIFASMIMLLSSQQSHAQDIEDYGAVDNSDSSPSIEDTGSGGSSGKGNGIDIESYGGDSAKKDGILSKSGRFLKTTKTVTNVMQFIMGFMGVDQRISALIISIIIAAILFFLLGFVSKILIFLAPFTLWISILLTSIIMLLLGNVYIEYMISGAVSLLILLRINPFKPKKKNDGNEQNKVNAAGGAKSLMDRIRFALQHGETFGDKLKMVFTSKEEREKVEKTLEGVRNFKMTCDPFILSLIRNLEILERAQAKGIATPEERILLEQARRDLADKIVDYQRLNINEARALSRQIQALQQRGISI